MRRRGAKGANLEILALEASDEPQAEDGEDHVEEKDQVCEKSVQAQHDEDDDIVAGIVAQVVVDSRLHLPKVGRL